MGKVVQQLGTWSCAPPKIDIARLLGVHKYKDMGKVRPVILKAAEKSAHLAEKLSDPCAYFVSPAIEKIDPDGATLADGTELNCRAFNDELVGSQQMLVFVVTLGPELDAAVSAGFADGSDPLGPLFLDTAGWLMIEAVTRAFSRFLKGDYFGTGFKLSTRMAPGYDYRVAGSSERAGWNLLEQEKLFELFSGHDLPIELLESGAMIPRMTRSGVFGVSAIS